MSETESAADAAALGQKPCRLCKSAKDLFKQALIHYDKAGASTENSQSAPKTGSGVERKAQGPQPFWDQEEAMPCPPDIIELGRSTWTFLHTMAAYYPQEPSQQQRSLMQGFIKGLGEFYPCSHCAQHLRQELSKNPPRVDSGYELSQYFCELHNKVNAALGRPAFDCGTVLERWRDGCDA